MTWLDSPFKSEISLQNPFSVARHNRLILRLKAHFPCKEARSKCPARRVEEIFYSGTTMHLASAWRPGTVTEVGAERSGSISVIPTDYTLTISNTCVRGKHLFSLLPTIFQFHQWHSSAVLHCGCTSRGAE